MRAGECASWWRRKLSEQHDLADHPEPVPANATTEADTPSLRAHENDPPPLLPSSIKYLATVGLRVWGRTFTLRHLPQHAAPEWRTFPLGTCCSTRITLLCRGPDRVFMA